MGSVDMDETSFMEEDVEGSWESLLTAAPVLVRPAVLGSPHFSSSPPSPALLYISALSILPLCVLSHPAVYR